MAEIHGGQIAARQLRAAGIDTVFGVVAGPMIELFAGSQEAGLQVVGCRHELNGGFMAQAWGYQKRKAGVLIVGSGPALTNAITPLYVATASALPLVVLGGSAFGGTLGLGAFQELDQLALAKPACKWTGQVDRTDRIAEWIHLALGKAVEGRPGGVYLDFPGHLVGKKVPEEQVTLRSAPGDHARLPRPRRHRAHRGSARERRAPARAHRQGRGLGRRRPRAREARRPRHPLRHVADGARHAAGRSPELRQRGALAGARGRRRDRDVRRPLQLDLRPRPPLRRGREDRAGGRRGRGGVLGREPHHRDRGRRRRRRRAARRRARGPQAALRRLELARRAARGRREERGRRGEGAQPTTRSRSSPTGS